MLRVLAPIEVDEGDRRIRIEPARELRVSYAVDFAHPAIGRQELKLDRLDARRFEAEIAPARTFGFLQDVRALWNAGLAQGGSLDNTVLLDETRVMNEGGLRWPDEFVRHKVLDLLGDLALLGVAIEGHVKVERGGHALHHRLVAALLDRPKAWRLREAGARRARDLAPAADARLATEARSEPQARQARTAGSGLVELGQLAREPGGGGAVRELDAHPRASRAARPARPHHAALDLVVGLARRQAEEQLQARALAQRRLGLDEEAPGAQRRRGIAAQAGLAQVLDRDAQRAAAEAPGRLA